MKTYLIPVDFSETSLHAAEFASQLSKQTDVSTIILMHSYHVTVYESVLPTPDMVPLTETEIAENIGKKKAQLEHIKTKVHKLVRKGVEIKTCLSTSPLIRAIIETVNKNNADLVILGSNGLNTMNDSYIGSNVIDISKLSPVPVIVVPPACCYELIKKVVMACDFKKVKSSIPLESLKRLLSRHDVDLLVVNVDPAEKHKHHDAEQLAEETALHSMLKEYHPGYYYNNNGDVINGILNFANEHHSQLVIALPHKYSFFQSLLHDSVSHRLSVQSAIPVLLLK